MKKIFFALMMGLAIFACTPEAYDDTAIKEQIDNLDDRLSKVEEDLATIELNVAAMKTLAEALKTGKYIESVVALEDGTGYTITFSDETTIVVKNGEKGDKGETGDKGDKGDTGAAGADGKTPTVTVKEVDGVLYWLINGEQGPAVYEEAPVFTSVDGNLYVTYPGGEPQFVGALTGVSIFKSVVVNEEKGTVTFTFVGENGEAGDSFDLPLAEKFALEIITSVGLANDQTSVEIPYTVKGANATTTVDVLAVACEAVVEAEVIKVSNIAAGAQMLVFADNGEGKTSIRKVVFATEAYSVEAVDYVIPAEGGQVVVKGVSNVPFEVVIPAEAAWLSQVAAKSAFALTFAAEKNEGEERSAKVDFVRKGTEEVLMSVTIAQPVANVVEFATLVWNASVPFGGGQDRNMTMDSEYIYVAQAAPGNGAVKAISIADPKQTKDVKVTTYTPAGLDNGTHALTCVRMLPNTDPAVNGGKPVLVGSNLTTGDGTETLIVYVWSNGIDADPNYFVIDSGGRRVGDKFTVKGTYQSGELHFFDFNDGNTVIRVNMKDGVAGLWGTPELAYATGRFAIPVGGAENIGECTIHPDVTYDFSSGETAPSAALLTTNAVNGFFTHKSGNALELSAWGTDPKLTQTFGYNFFEHGGKDCIAYVKVAGDRNSAALNIIEDVNGAADFKGTLEAQKVLFTAPVNGTGNAGHGLGDCATVVIDGTRYIAVMAQNIGISLYKLN